MNQTPNSSPQLSPGQKFTKEINQLCQGALLNGLPLEQVLGTFIICSIFYLGPAVNNSLAQAEQMSRAKGE